MPAFLNSDIARLAHQLTLSPKRLRPRQIEGIEAVLALVQPDKSYPFDWVCFHVTGYQKRGTDASASIPGEALIADLVVMAEFITRREQLPVSALVDQGGTQEDVAKQLSVSTKTIRRWRRRGLLGVRVMCEDGVSRLIFPQKGVERFKANNAELVAKAASFRQLTDDERCRIIERAKELVGERKLKLHETARTIAAETGRAIETIRYTLRRYDRANKATAVFASEHEPVLTPQQQAMWDAHQAGDSEQALAKAFKLTPRQAAEALAEIQVRLWKREKVEFVYNALFDAPNADALILDVPEPACAVAEGPTPDADLPAYLRSLYRTPLLSPKQEQDIFRRYNYIKYKIHRRLASIRGFSASPEEVREISTWFRRAGIYRDRIVQANLRLVVSIAKRHVGRSDAFFEVVSDGNVSLMRAVEKFDFSRGFRFSTYASWAVMKNYARTIPEERYRAMTQVTGQDELLAAAPDVQTVEASEMDVAHVRDAIRRGLEQLSPREREVVTEHFGLGRPDGQGATLEDLGRRYGVTKERVRQIEKRAVAKLRQFLPPTLGAVFSAA